MSDKSLFQITYDIFGYSPGGIPRDGVIMIPCKTVEELQYIPEINSRFQQLIADHNKKTKENIIAIDAVGFLDYIK